MDNQSLINTAEIESDESSHVDENDSSDLKTSVPTPAELADRYRFTRELGHGAQGTVYLAERFNGEGPVAIKRLEIDSVQNWKDYELFHREADVLKTLNIKGVAKFIEAPDFTDIPNPCAYIVQEYIDGLSLETMMRNGYRLTLNKIFRLALNLIDILEQLHSHVPPIIHRDIKPANILMKPLENGDFLPFLIDFGAVSNPQIQSGGSTVAGTYGYMPPEQLMGRPVPASDIYSLAAMIAYLLSGVEPGEMQVMDFRLVIHPYLENVPKSVVSVLNQMLAPKVEDRLADYSVLRERFEHFIQDQFELSDVPNAASENSLALREVKALGQRGNTDLWISLPEHTPRSIPKEYKDLVEGCGLEPESVYPKLIRYNSYARRYYKYLLITPLVLIILGIILMIIGSFIEAVSFVFIPTGGIFSGVAILLALFFYHISLKKTNKYKEYRDYPYHYLPSGQKMFETLFTKGTKSIATVVSCEYCPSESSRMEPYYLTKMVEDPYVNINGKHPLKPEDNQITAYYHARPIFKLIYKFNPPDDDNPDDLYHTIFVHSDFSETLKVGDPLPILYYINPKDNLNVMSMPFPYPLHDFVSYEDMIHFKEKNNDP